MTVRTWIVRGAVGLVGCATAGAIGYLAAIAPSGTGFMAKTMCSAVFVSGRDPASLDTAEFAGVHPVLRLIAPEVDRNRHEVRADLLGLGEQKAVYRPGLGCTLAALDETLPPAPAALTEPISTPADALDIGVVASPGIGVARLEAAVDRAFAEPNPDLPRRTRALLVLYRGNIVAERYAPGFTKDTQLIGYSMSKTVTGALAGILVGRGLIDPDAPAPVATWHGAGDPRAQIRVQHLLNMTSGLEWDESTDPLSDLIKMLYRPGDMAAKAADHRLSHPPGSFYRYSSGTANILSRVLLTAMHEDRDAYLALPRTALFGPAGMRSAVFEADDTGTLVGSSHVWASARDWARFGELYLNDGARNGVQVLPKGWVARSATPVAAAGRGRYGNLVWLNQGSPETPADREHPMLPPDMILMDGHFGQVVAVIPSRELVIVRLGESRGWTAERDTDALLRDMLSALHAEQQADADDELPPADLADEQFAVTED